MLTEMQHVRQMPEDGFRRWFWDDELDLMVWYKPDKSVHGFQLCYDKTGREKALTWFEDRGFSHEGVDPGDETPLKNRSAILVADGRFDQARVLASFKACDEKLPAKLRALVRRKLNEYGRSIEATRA